MKNSIENSILKSTIAQKSHSLLEEGFIELTNVTFSYGYPQEYPYDSTHTSEQGCTPQQDAEVGGDDNHPNPSRGVSVASRDAANRNSTGEDAANGFGANIYDRDNAIEDVSLSINKGEFVVFLGRNGSGKSTLAKLLNALLIPDKGVVIVKGMQTTDPESVWEIRRSSGMVFQNPDNQIVGTTVEEDVAFGVENIGVPSAEIRERIDASMAETGIQEFAQRPPYQLSGGQKQRVAIAGILAMKPECVILDEATSMLDPDGRREVMRLVRKLNAEENIAVVLITHHMDEAAFADRVYIVDGGHVVMSRTPKELFGDGDLIRSIGLDVPQITEVFEILRERGFTDLPAGVTSVDDAYDALAQLLSPDGPHDRLYADR